MSAIVSAWLTHGESLPNNTRSGPCARIMLRARLGPRNGIEVDTSSHTGRPISSRSTASQSNHPPKCAAMIFRRGKRSLTRRMRSGAAQRIRGNAGSNPA